MTSSQNMAAEGKAPFVVMVKPVGSRCNMRCRYCYYLGADNVMPAPFSSALPVAGTGVASTPSSSARVMSYALLERFISDYVASVPGPVVSFTWHGGEPTLAGLDFYREAVRLEKKYLPEGWECWNSLQTNGLLLDDEWCDFIAAEHFDVGISIDGTEAVHDANRLDVGGTGTWDRVMAAVGRLKARGVLPDLLCTVNHESAGNGAAVYRALRDLGTGWIQFIPIVIEGEKSGLSIPPGEYGEFLVDAFAEWFYHDLGRGEVQLFSETAMMLNGKEASLCWLQKKCGKVLVVEADGGVYACDHFVRQDHLIGALGTEKAADDPSGEHRQETAEAGSLPLLRTLADSGFQREFGARKETELTEQCRECPYLELCHGGCIKDRTAKSLKGESGHNILCPGLYRYFDYAVPRLRRAMALSAAGKKPQEIMQICIREEREKYRKIQRNDPCPCGSGKKYKQCCMKRVP